jgi:hypothetical protein
MTRQLHRHLQRSHTRDAADLRSPARTSTAIHDILDPSAPLHGTRSRPDQPSRFIYTPAANFLAPTLSRRFRRHHGSPATTVTIGVNR